MIKRYKNHNIIYFREIEMLDNYAQTDLELMVGRDEKILWHGKPNKRCFVLEGIFNPLLPFALVWFLFDSVFNNVADLYSSNVRVNGRPLEVGTTIADIKDYRKVFELIKKLQEDIYTDTMYPNDLRPETNHGYTTKYKGLD